MNNQFPDNEDIKELITEIDESQKKNLRMKKMIYTRVKKEKGYV